MKFMIDSFTAEEPSESFQSGSPVDRLRIVKERMTGNLRTPPTHQSGTKT